MSTAHKAAVIPWQPDIAALMPHARRIDWQGQPRLVVPHDVEHARMLRNVGIMIPSPILGDYQWGGRTPWEAQRQTAAMLTVSPRAYVLNEMRTGKTFSVLGAADYLMRKGVIRRALVIAPLSTLSIVWAREILMHFPHRTAQVLHGTAERRRKRLAEPADFYVINHDGPETIFPELQGRIAQDIDLVVFDELAVYRESRTNRWRVANKLLNQTAGRMIWAWGLTGKPTPNAPTDAYGQGRLITPSRLPKYFKDFRDRTMLKVSQFKYVPKREAQDIVHEALKPSVRYTRADISESAPVMHLQRECALSPKASQVMTGLINRMRVMQQEGNITAHNAGILVNKLLQVATGWVYTDDRKVVDISSPSRLAAIDEILQETDRKVLVFVPYVHAVRGVADYLTKKGYETAMVYGDTPLAERNEIFTAFQQTSRYDVLVAHPQCMAHGLILTAADTAVWYGPPPSNEIYAQANDRIALPGLSYSTAVIHIVGHAVERRRYAALTRQETMQEQLLDMLNGVQEQS